MSTWRIRRTPVTARAIVYRAVTRDDAIDAARAIRSQRYPGASVLFAAGSIVRGDATPHSDLDLVVICPSLTAAYRESFVFGRLPVEAFVHDPETVEYFFVDVDERSGKPSLPAMVHEGVEVPHVTPLSAALKTCAAAILAAGAAAADIRRRRAAALRRHRPCRRHPLAAVGRRAHGERGATLRGTRQLPSPRDTAVVRVAQSDPACARARGCSARGPLCARVCRPVRTSRRIDRRRAGGRAAPSVRWVPVRRLSAAGSS